MFLKNAALLLAVCLAVATTGCTNTSTSNTARTAKEQMLLSNAVDQSLDKVDFTSLSGQSVFVEDKYLECVDKNYVVGSLRHRVMRAGGALAPAADAADVIMEVRSGGVGTDSTEMYLGVPSLPLPAGMQTPEIRLSERKSQYGYSKLGLVVFDAKTKAVLGDGGMSMAQSDDNNWYVLGMGPWQDGTLKGDVASARRVPHGMKMNRLPTQVAFDAPNPADPNSVRFASDAKDVIE
ncbi:MAG: hypothetical protein H7Z17_20555 [Fuerstia sp.]|nr:hypothetical protein [Fuerstiella sp.]